MIALSSPRGIGEGHRSTRRRQSVGRWVFVCASLLAALLVLIHEAVTRWSYDASIETVATVTNNTMPTLVHLAEIRRAVRSVYAEAALDVPEREELERGSAARWPVIDSHLASYEDLPTLEGEAVMRRDLATALEALRRADARLLAATTEDERQTVMERELLPRARATFDVLDALIIENARGSGDAADAIVLAHARASALSKALVLALVSVFVVAAGAGFVALRRSERGLARHLEELDAFAGRVAHDLKSPLAPALLGVKLLAREPLPPSGAETLDRVERSLRRAADLVDGLLAFARAGARSRPDARTRVSEALTGLTPGLRALAEAEQARLDLDVPPDLEVQADSVEVASVLDNLARNGLLYLGPSARREVRVSARAVGRRALIEVADTGAGIPKDVLSRLFEPFVRGSDRAGGSGLGLATVKRIVEAHGGELEVESRLGVGSTFRVWLPSPE